MIKSTVMADDNISADREKSLYLIQVRYLDEQLERLQLKCDQTSKQNQKLIGQTGALRVDMEDICEYLKYSTASKQQEVQQLSEQLEVRLQEEQQKQEDLEVQRRRQKENVMEEVEELQEECRKQEVMMEQQQKRLSDLQSLRKQLEAQREEQEASKQKQPVAEVVEKMRQMEECYLDADDNLQRRRMAAVEEWKAQYADVAQQVRFLLNDNQALWMEKDEAEHRISQLQRRTDGMKKHLRLVSSSVNNLQQDVEKWEKRCHQRRVKVKENSSFHHSLLDEEQTLKENLISVSENLDQKTAGMEELKLQLKKEKICRKQLEKDVKEAVSILRPMLMVSELSPDAQQMLPKLKKIFQRNRPVMSDPTQETSTEPEPEPERCVSSDALVLMARCRPGDFGIIPRPSWNLGDAKHFHR